MGKKHVANLYVTVFSLEHEANECRWQQSDVIVSCRLIRLYQC